ncbi:DUF2207 domain-containing protein [Treponema sp.]
MKYKGSCIFAVALFLIAPFFAFAEEAFLIDHYQIDMKVRENNSYEIREIISADFSQERHGLIREIPLAFDGTPVKISNISVPGFESSIERGQDILRVRIGSADTYVKGKLTYTLSYIYDVGADKLPDMDEFNHNVIGTQWDTTIEAADFSIQLPKAFKAENVNCTIGTYGSTSSEGVEWKVEGSTITGHLTRPLYNFEGLTVALPLPEGYWVGAQTHRKPYWLLFTLLGYPLYALVIVVAFLLWFFKGRDNKLFPSVQFEAPEGLTPSEIGYIIDGRVDAKDVTSLILYWAEKGYLAVEETEGGKGKARSLSLIKLKDMGSDARSYEKYIFDKLFSFGSNDQVSTSELTNKFYPTIAWAQDNITKTFTDNPEKSIFDKGSTLNTLLVGFLAALPIMAILTESFASMMGEGPMALVAIPFSLFIVIPVLIFGSAMTGKNSGGKAAIFIPVLFGSFSLVFFSFFVVFAAGNSFLKYLAAILACFVVGIFVSIMSRRTEYGDRILEKVLGFRDFIKTAENDKLEKMFESNPGYFYNILPYATVLGLSNKWASHFEGLSVSAPTWYRGYRSDGFRVRDFERDLNRNFSTLNTSLSSSPSSSGRSGSSSSGGFSGGGSGGGGGGSW